MDDLKRHVAELTHEMIERELAPRIRRVGGVESVEIIKVNDLITDLRVRTDIGGGSRYFTIKVSESI